MKNLTVANMLDVWEQGLQQPPVQRAVILLSAAFPDMQPDTLLELSIGRRDQMLLRIRERLFGQQLLNTAQCPLCGEQAEWENRVADFLIPQDANETELFELQEDEYVLRFRLPNSLDIAAALNQDDQVEAQLCVLSRCLATIKHGGKDCTIDQLPETVLEKLKQRIEEADQQAEIRLQLTCPACSHQWEVLFDIVIFLWKELSAWAERMLQTVHRLAVGYGWSEQEILALSPIRRHLYLGMLGI
jgi:hypothetical protein